MIILLAIISLILASSALELLPPLDGIFFQNINIDFFKNFNFSFFRAVTLFYTIAFSMLFWVLAYLEIIDYVLNMFGYGTELLKDQSLSIKKDLVIPFVSSIFLVYVYWSDTEVYSFRSIDLGSAAIPLLLSSLYVIVQMFRIKVSNKPLKRSILFLFLLVASLILVFLLLCLVQISSQNYTTAEAFWYQLTFLCASFVFFMQSHQTLYFLQVKEIYLSNFRIKSMTGLFTRNIAAERKIFDIIESINSKLR